MSEPAMTWVKLLMLVALGGYQLRSIVAALPCRVSEAATAAIKFDFGLARMAK
jgi:hypothetical protein